MKKLTKIVAAVALLSCMTGACAALAGCSGAEAAREEVGTYHYNYSEYAAITQGKLMRAYSEVLTIYSDNTYTLCSVFDCYYSSDGESYNPVSYMAATAYGAYEVVSEDADLGEMTIKVSNVSRLITADYDTASSDFSGDISGVVTALTEKEIILASDYKMSDTFNLAINIAYLSE